MEKITTCGILPTLHGGGKDDYFRHDKGAYMRRRVFLSASPLLLYGTRFACSDPFQSQAAPSGADLPEELSAPELEMANSSVMAKDLDNFFGKGFS